LFHTPPAVSRPLGPPSLSRPLAHDDQETQVIKTYDHIGLQTLTSLHAYIHFCQRQLLAHKDRTIAAPTLKTPAKRQLDPLSIYRLELSLLYRSTIKVQHNTDVPRKCHI
jgi:hypothetical protein